MRFFTLTIMDISKLCKSNLHWFPTFCPTKLMQNDKEAITICKVAVQSLMNGSQSEGKTKTIQLSRSSFVLLVAIAECLRWAEDISVQYMDKNILNWAHTVHWMSIWTTTDLKYYFTFEVSLILLLTILQTMQLFEECCPLNAHFVAHLFWFINKYKYDWPMRMQLASIS